MKTPVQILFFYPMLVDCKTISLKKLKDDEPEDGYKTIKTDLNLEKYLHRNLYLLRNHKARRE